MSNPAYLNILDLHQIFFKNKTIYPLVAVEIWAH